MQGSHRERRFFFFLHWPCGNKKAWPAEWAQSRFWPARLGPDGPRPRPARPGKPESARVARVFIRTPDVGHASDFLAAIVATSTVHTAVISQKRENISVSDEMAPTTRETLCTNGFVIQRARCSCSLLFKPTPAGIAARPAPRH